MTLKDIPQTSVLSDSWQEHLKISDGNVETHDFADSIPNYGEFSI